MKLLKNSDGFSAIEVILIIVLSGIIGGLGYHVYNSQKETKNLLENSSSEHSVPTMSKNTKSENVTPSVLTQYSNKSVRLSFDYQKDWKISDDSGQVPPALTISSSDKIRTEREGISFISEGGEISIQINKTTSKSFETRDGEYLFNCEFGDECTLDYFIKSGSSQVDGVDSMTGKCGHHSPGTCTVVIQNGFVYRFGYYQPNREVVGGSNTPENKYAAEYKRLLSSVKFLK